MDAQQNVPQPVGRARLTEAGLHRVLQDIQGKGLLFNAIEHMAEDKTVERALVFPFGNERALLPVRQEEREVRYRLYQPGRKLPEPRRHVEHPQTQQALLGTFSQGASDNLLQVYLRLAAFHEKVAEDVALVVLAERRRRAPQTVCALRTGACVVPGREPGPGKKLRVKGGGRADCPFLPVAVHGMDIVPFFPQIGDHLPPLFFEEGAQRTAEAGAGEYPGKKVKGRFIALCDRPFEVDLDDPLLEGRRPLQKQPVLPFVIMLQGVPAFLER